MGDGFDHWKKGGVRQSALEAVVPAYLSPRSVTAFFVATRKLRRFPWSSLNPLVTFRKEFVLAATNHTLAVLRLKRPAIFRAAIADVEAEVDLADPSIKWDGKRIAVADENYFPIPFHDEDAARVVSRCQAVRRWSASA